jgi:hypothetical protein
MKREELLRFSFFVSSSVLFRFVLVNALFEFMLFVKIQPPCDVSSKLSEFSGEESSTKLKLRAVSKINFLRNNLDKIGKHYYLDIVIA